jgi:hypothetical protein
MRSGSVGGWGDGCGAGDYEGMHGVVKVPLKPHGH